MPTGFQFPFGSSPTGLPASASDEELVRQSVIQLAMTRCGERIMRPEIGTGAYDYVFENNNALFQVAVQYEISSAISRFEPRAMVTSVDVEAVNENELLITVNYIYLPTGEQQSVPLPTMPTPTPVPLPTP